MDDRIFKNLPLVSKHTAFRRTLSCLKNSCLEGIFNRLAKTSLQLQETMKLKLKYSVQSSLKSYLLWITLNVNKKGLYCRNDVQIIFQI